MLVQFDNSVLELKGMTNSASALHFALSRLSHAPQLREERFCTTRFTSSRRTSWRKRQGARQW